MTRVVGADARQREGYWTVTLLDGAPEHVELFSTFDDVLDHARDADRIMVDIAAGHDDPEGHADGRRACETAARGMLGEHQDRIFLTPPPKVFEADHYHEAQAWCEENDWPPLPRPIWHGRHRVRTVTQAAAHDDRILEGHPEVTYTLLHESHGGEGPLEHYGDAYNALLERSQLLEQEGWDTDKLTAPEAQPRKILDAAAMAKSAHRAANGRAQLLPEDPPADPRTGRPVAFHA